MGQQCAVPCIQTAASGSAKIVPIPQRTDFGGYGAGNQ